MKLRRNRTRKFRWFWKTEQKDTTRRADKWPAWKKDIQIARYVSLLK